jgi:transcription elongation factor Elf1
MSQTTTARDTTAALPAPAGFTLPCPCCGQQEASISVNLAFLEGEGALRCNECEEEFDVQTVRALIRRWTKVLDWVCAAPQFGSDE